MDFPLSKNIDSAKMRQSQTPPKESDFELNSLDCSRPRIPALIGGPISTISRLKEGLCREMMQAEKKEGKQSGTHVLFAVQVA